MRYILPVLLCLAGGAQAFCGFYVAKADTKLFNQASKVVIVRDGDKTTLTMASDYQGDLKEFAAVFPVPVVLKEEDIGVVREETITHLDNYSAPRLVEYHDPDPCAPIALFSALEAAAAPDPAAIRKVVDELGVKVEAEYQIEEYDVVILSAKESGGLEVWLRQNGYRIPEGAAEVLGSYIKQNMRFFVAKVNLEEQAALGYTYLRPLRVSYESKKFALPIRLGTVNAKGDQELFAFVITRAGRVECTNYKTVKLPTGMDLPVYVKNEFPAFYRDMFSYQCAKERDRAVFLEYAWNMNWCDPCAAEPLSPRELRELGCDWIPDQARGQAREAFVTRLHVRYNAETFPEDLQFQNTGDNTNFQGRYVMRHPWTGKGDCDAAKSYREQLGKRHAQEIENLHKITGWDLDEIRGKVRGK